MVFREEYCKKCGKEYTNVSRKWCKPCYLNFTTWTSGNKKIDDFIQEMQLQFENYNGIGFRRTLMFEWIPYNQFNDIKEIKKNDSNTLYSAVWKDGLLCYNMNKKEWKRIPDREVTLKYLHNSQNTIDKLLSEV
jgi:hypothetical protein